MEQGAYKIGLTGVGLTFLENVQEFQRIEPQTDGKNLTLKTNISWEQACPKPR